LLRKLSVNSANVPYNFSEFPAPLTHLSRFVHFLGVLPLRLLHAVGGVLGVLAYHMHGKTKARTLANLALAGGTLPAVPSASAVSTAMGQGVLELPWLWRQPYSRIAERIQIDADSAATVVAPGATIFLTPHLGSFEVVGYYIAAHRPLTAMYSPPNVQALDAVMRAGRQKGQCTAVPADLSGIKAMLKALRRGEAVGVLPDQAPSTGDGVWADLFGKPAYTMTLISKLATSTGARLVMGLGVRLPHATGFALRYYALPPLPADPPAAAQALNRYVEQAIAHCPEQYLWAYNRYKRPGGAPEAPP
jgi:Kdo2-lipid IVA lauroyltransferase/acyltransferase